MDGIYSEADGDYVTFVNGDVTGALTNPLFITPSSPSLAGKGLNARFDRDVMVGSISAASSRAVACTTDCISGGAATTPTPKGTPPPMENCPAADVDSAGTWLGVSNGICYK